MREDAYITSIPATATEKVLTIYENRSAKRAEYYVEGRLIGIRTFHPTGEVEMEEGYKDGKLHGNSYRFDNPGELLFSTQYVNGLEHGTAYKWGRDGRLIGSYEMEFGTGFDLWFDESYDDLEERSVILSDRLSAPSHTSDTTEWELQGIGRDASFKFNT